MDMVISQTDPRYLDAAMRYARILEQRNRLLRDGAADHALFEAMSREKRSRSRSASAGHPGPVCDTRVRPGSSSLPEMAL